MKRGMLLTICLLELVGSLPLFAQQPAEPVAVIPIATGTEGGEKRQEPMTTEPLLVQPYVPNSPVPPSPPPPPPAAPTPLPPESLAEIVKPPAAVPVPSPANPPRTETTPPTSAGPRWRPATTPIPSQAAPPRELTGQESPVSFPLPVANSAPDINLKMVPIQVPKMMPARKGSDFASARNEPPPAEALPMPRKQTPADPPRPGQQAPLAWGTAWQPPPSTVAAVETGPPQVPVEQPGVDPLRPGFQARAEYLLWWSRPAQIPILATTGPAVRGGPGAEGGDLGFPGTIPILGPGTISYGSQSGFRLTASCWLAPWFEEGLEISGFYLAQGQFNVQLPSSSYPVLARPFLDQATGQQRAQFVAFPGVGSGTLTVQSPSQLWGLEFNGRCQLCCGECCKGTYRLDVIAGPRYLNLQEALTMSEDIQYTGSAVNAPSRNQPLDLRNAHQNVVDHFATSNQFGGGQVGLDFEWRHGPWSVGVRGKLALGVTVQDITIQGSNTVLLANGTSQSFVGGLLAEPSNNGRHTHNNFSVVPEVGLNAGYQVTEHLRGLIGYNFLDWTGVVRPGDQIDTVVNSGQVPLFPPTNVPATRPAVLYRTSNFWAQGLTLGLEFCF